jgi:unsaturated rhamnogalacturonyl hydrolase
MIIQAVSYALLFIVILILLIDIVPVFKNWLGRIHIGRYNSIKVWNESMTKIGVKWLSNTPKIKVTDNTRLVVIDMLKGNYTKRAIQHWQEAALILGLSEYLKQNDDKEVKNEILKYLNSKFDSNGQWIEKPEYVDGAILAYGVMKLDFIDIDQYKKAFDYIWEMLKEHIGEDGTVMYRKFMKNYRYVDTIGFICPFLVSYGLRYNIEECIKLSINQVKEYEKYGMHKEHYLPCHAYEIKGEMPLGLYGWGRGLGWFAIGLIDTWNELPPTHKYKKILDESVEKYARAIMEFQQDDGSWNWTVSRSECRKDSSATSTLCWFLLNASKLNGISDDCQMACEKAFKHLMRVTRRNGAIDFSQGDTKDIGVYSSQFNILPFTQGFSIRSINFYSYLSQMKQMRNIS